MSKFSEVNKINSEENLTKLADLQVLLEKDEYPSTVAALTSLYAETYLFEDAFKSSGFIDNWIIKIRDIIVFYTTKDVKIFELGTSVLFWLDTHFQVESPSLLCTSELCGMLWKGAAVSKCYTVCINILKRILGYCSSSRLFVYQCGMFAYYCS